MTEVVHATAVARCGRDGWQAVLLAGPSGSGKSGLALRLLDLGWRLVGDDYVRLWSSGGRLFVRAGENIDGLIEARGVGLVPSTALRLAPVALWCDASPGEPDRLPPATVSRIKGVDIPSVAVDFSHPTAPAKVARALSTLGCRRRLP